MTVEGVNEEIDLTQFIGHKNITEEHGTFSMSVISFFGTNTSTRPVAEHHEKTATITVTINNQDVTWTGIVETIYTGTL